MRPPRPTAAAVEKVIAESSRAFRIKDKAERARYALATDGASWLCVVFQTSEERLAFVRLAGLSAEVDATGRYVAGPVLAKRLGIEYGRDRTPYARARGPDPKLKAAT